MAGTTLSTEGAGQSVTNSGICTDRTGNAAAPATVSDINIDKTPPVIAGLPAQGCTLWPPNHSLVQVATVTVRDALSAVAPGPFGVSGSSKEPENGLGDGDLGPDILITGGSVQLRAERSGTGNGRGYSLTPPPAIWWVTPHRRRPRAPCPTISASDPISHGKPGCGVHSYVCALPAVSVLSAVNV